MERNIGFTTDKGIKSGSELWDWPIKNAILSYAYGPRYMPPTYNTLNEHNGIDLISFDKNIYLVADAEAVWETTHPIMGNVIIARHSVSLLSVYCHLEKTRLPDAPRPMAKSEIIGVMGGTGNNGKGYEVHLHFMALYKLTPYWTRNAPEYGKHMDPIPLLPHYEGRVKLFSDKYGQIALPFGRTLVNRGPL